MGQRITNGLAHFHRCHVAFIWGPARAIVDEPRFAACHIAGLSLDDVRKEPSASVVGSGILGIGVGLELVIMAPEMLTPLAVPEQAYPQGTLYVVVSHWATDGEFGSYEAPFTNLMDAQRQFHDDLKNELESGCVEKWREKSQFAEEETAESYECYLDGEYCENHFYLSIEKRPLPLAPEFIRTVAAVYEDECAREDFLDKAQALPEYLALTEDQKKQLLHNADIKGRISHYLDLCDTYWECYWDAVSKAAQDILQDDQQASPQK